MEEKKLKGQAETKSIQGSSAKQKQQKLSYDQLNEACAQLYQQNQYLTKQLQQANVSNMFKRLDYLFMVLRYEAVIKDPEFVNSCIEEIKSAMTPAVPDNPKEEE